MSGRVDVRAVLRRHADLADQVACDAQRAEAHAVYASVAELIEAADLVRDAIDNDGVSEALFDRLCAALARVGGAS